MAKVVKSPVAKRDLLEIWEYIADDNLEAANRVLKQIDERCEKLLFFPSVGAPRDFLIQSIRSSSVGNYIIFYRRHDQDLEIVRVLHGARDIESLFDK